jgi:hypothetical protein
MQHLAVENALARAAGDDPDAGAVAAAALGVWLRMAARLTPVIGAQGVDVLFRRALLVTGRAHDCLATVDNDADTVALQESLRLCLSSRETAVAVEAGGALLICFTELLASLIGEALTERLLEPVWAFPTS